MSKKARLEGVLDINNKPFIKGMNEAVAKGKAAGGIIAESFKGLGGALAVGAVVAFGKATVDLGSKLQDTSERLNLNVESVQGLSFAFGQSGASSVAFEKSFVKLNQSIDDAIGGNEKAQASFSKLGVSLLDLHQNTPEQVLMQIADGMKNATDPTEALASAMDVLGKSGIQLVPGLKQGSDALAELSASAEKLSAQDVASLDDFGDAVDRLSNKFKVLGAQAALSGFSGPGFFANVGDVITGAAIKTDAPGYMEERDARKAIEAREAALPQLGKSVAPGSAGPAGTLRRIADEQARLDKMNADMAGNAQSEWDNLHRKNMEEAARVIRKYRFDQLDGESKVNELVKERLKIQKQIAETGDKSGQRSLEYAKKSVEIARQMRENEKEKENKSAAVMQAAAVSASATRRRGLTTGGLTTGGLSTGGLSGDAYKLIRSGDTARRKAEEEAKKTTDEPMSATAYNTAQIAKAFGLQGRTSNK